MKPGLSRGDDNTRLSDGMRTHDRHAELDDAVLSHSRRVLNARRRPHTGAPRPGGNARPTSTFWDPSTNVPMYDLPAPNPPHRRSHSLGFGQVCTIAIANAHLCAPFCPFAFWHAVRLFLLTMVG